MKGMIILKKISKFAINHKKTTLIIYIICLLISMFEYPKIGVNYNINDYLPKDSESTVAIEKMDEEYGEDVPNMRVMLKNVSISETLDYIEKIKALDAVKSVNWLNDTENVFKPESFMDKDRLETYYKNNNALLTITVDKDEFIRATDEIRKIVGKDNAMTGASVNTAIATVNSVDEIRVVTIIGVLFVIFILIFTTQAWIEPLIVMTGLFFAIVINAGTNIIFKEISFVTNAAGNILLLAVSLDYSVFMLHRYKEEKNNCEDHITAMERAIENSFTSILSSALTTVIGFVALVFMRFTIGADLGLALAKGVVISLISVFTLLPVIILYMDHFIDRTEHKKLLPSFDKFANFVFKHRKIFMVLFLIMVIPSYLASTHNNFYFGNSHIYGMNTKLGQDTHAIEEEFGKSDTYVLIVPKEDLEKQKALSGDLKELDGVTDIISYVDTVGETIPGEFLDKDLLKKLNSKNYTRMILSVGADFEGDKTVALIDEIKALANKYYPEEYYLAGEGISTYDLKNTVTADMTVVNLIAVFAIYLVLLITQKSVSLPIMLVATIETAIFVNMSVPYYIDRTIFYISYLIISSIQLGATVDYAILLTERYNEYRETLDRENAIKKTISTVTVSLLTSALALIIVGFLLGIYSTHGLISQLGTYLGVGTIASVIMVLFVLPSMLYSFDKFIQKTTKGLNFVNDER